MTRKPRISDEEMIEERSNSNRLAAPPDQVSGVLVFHRDPDLDAKIRQVFRLIYEDGHTVDTVAKAIGKSKYQVYTYLRQIRETIHLYMQTFPDEFERSDAAISLAVQRRQALDRMMRAELRAMGEPGQAMRSKVGLYRVLVENLKGVEELTGLHLQRVIHSDEEGNPLPPAIYASPRTLAEIMRDVQEQQEEPQGAGSDDQPDPPG